MRWLILVFGFAVLLAGCTAHSNGAVSPPTPAIEIPGSVVCQWARVRRVTDGDTIRVDFEDGASNQAVRYIGVDAPETVDPVRGVQPFGPEASAENSRMVSGQRLCLEKDVSETDRYDRLLRYAWLADGTMVNEALVLSGLATVDTFPPDVKYVERFIAAQRDARAARRGMWTN